jgi:hypothetical protein
MRFCGRRLGLLAIAWTLALAPPAVAQDGICTAKVPPNVDAGLLAAAFVQTLARSETFRRQCLRIAATRVLRIHIAIVPPPGGDYRAVTAIARYDTGSLRAHVLVVFGENYIELLAHELEHVLEQIDGVDLRTGTVSGRAQAQPDGSFETRRATAAGRQVWREYEALAPEAPRRRQMRFR